MWKWLENNNFFFGGRWIHAWNELNDLHIVLADDVLKAKEEYKTSKNQEIRDMFIKTN